MGTAGTNVGRGFGSFAVLATGTVGGALALALGSAVGSVGADGGGEGAGGAMTGPAASPVSVVTAVATVLSARHASSAGERFRNTTMPAAESSTSAVSAPTIPSHIREAGGLDTIVAAASGDGGAICGVSGRAPYGASVTSVSSAGIGACGVARGKNCGAA